jgi:aspartate/methionine/tyrosine aminotransferase
MSHDAFFSKDAHSFRPSAIRAFAKLINDPNIISFAGGVPNPETFPAEQIAAIAEKVIRERRAVALQYGPTRGLPRLCASIAEICATRGIDVHGGRRVVTTGSQQALDLIAHTLLDPGDVVAVELPTYIGGSASFFARSAELVGVQQDDEGIVPESLREVASRRRIKLLYTIPNFQNPSGRLMTQERRAAVLEIAEELDFLVIEDDPYGELVYVDGADTTAMASRDRSGRVLYLGSFSKVLAPGLRCGWIVARSRCWSGSRSRSRPRISARGCSISRSSTSSDRRRRARAADRSRACVLSREARHHDRGAGEHFSVQSALDVRGRRTVHVPHLPRRLRHGRAHQRRGCAASRTSRAVRSSSTAAAATRCG